MYVSIPIEEKKTLLKCHATFSFNHGASPFKEGLAFGVDEIWWAKCRNPRDRLIYQFTTCTLQEFYKTTLPSVPPQT